ncbi:MAG TPA: deoxyribodipyrimidine photo-lyase, partial [bacterium]|nr:deoxyribodipyrimidine photo-lyase [bacterium]
MTGSSTRVIAESRLRRLNREPPVSGKFVLYWMQASQRTRDNHALEYAVQRANLLDLPLVTVFGLANGYPEATGAHYRFMLEGLAETRKRLERRKIGFRFLRESPPAAALRAGAEAALIVCDRGYLRHQVAWRKTVARRAGREVVEVETDALVPVDEASDRAEIGARTLRPKL